MAITLVQQKGAVGTSGSSASVSGLAATTSGNLLVALLSASMNPGDVAFTPPAGWVQAGVTVHNDVFVAISTAIYYYPNNPGGITSVSFTMSSAPSAWHIQVLEFSGIATTSPLDVTAAREQDHTTTPSSGAVTTTAAGDLLIGWIEVDDNNGAYTITEPTGWTALTTLADANGWSHTYSAYEVAGAAGSYNYQPTKSNSVTDCTCTIAAFKAASSGGTTQNAVMAPTAGMSAAFAAQLTAAGASAPSGSLSSGFSAQYVGQATSGLSGHGDSSLTVQRVALLAAALSGSLAANLSTGGGVIASGAFAGGAAAALSGLATFGATVSVGGTGASNLQALRTALAAAGFTGTLSAAQPGQLVANGAFSPTGTLAAALVFGNIVTVAGALSAGSASALSAQRTAQFGASPTGALAANAQASLLAKASAGLAGNLSSILAAKGIYVTSAQAAGLADALVTGLAFNPTALPPSALAVALLDGETVTLVGFLTGLSSTATLLDGITATATVKD